MVRCENCLNLCRAEVESRKDYWCIVGGWKWGREHAVLTYDDVVKERECPLFEARENKFRKRLFMELVKHAKEQHKCKHCGHIIEKGEEVVSIREENTPKIYFLCSVRCFSEYTAMLKRYKFYMTDELKDFLFSKGYL